MFPNLNSGITATTTVEFHVSECRSGQGLCRAVAYVWCEGSILRNSVFQPLVRNITICTPPMSIVVIMPYTLHIYTTDINRLEVYRSAGTWSQPGQTPKP